MYKGKIVSFSNLTGYGFVSCDGYANVFFHVRDNRGMNQPDLTVGTDVTYEVMADCKKNDRIRAVKMQLV